MLTITSPVTGGAQTGLTSPTYTLVADKPPAGAVGYQYAVSAIGGTQSGVDTTSSPSRPFTITTTRPGVLRTLSAVDPVTGVLRSVPRNTYTIRTRKGVTPLAGQSAVPAQAVTSIEIPAGADVADAPNVRAMLSLHMGALAQISAEIGNTAVTGVA
jgi:hypothetical protein